jgi:CheY-like chemotaxis protein
MKTILVIDDDTAFVEATEMLLTAKAFKVISAPNGEEGYVLARTARPELILLDVMMTHDSEGFETARKLKENPATKPTPIILITGVRQAKSLPAILEPDEEWLPVQAVLEKPVKPDQLLRSIEHALR